MAYVGRVPTRGQNREIDDISSSFNGSTTAFTLQSAGTNVSPGSVNQLFVNLGGVMQNPGTDYTVTNYTITFTTAPASGLTFWALMQGDSVDIQTPADDSVTGAKLAVSLVAGDVLYASGTDTLARLAKGSDGEVLKLASGVPSWAADAGGATRNATGTRNIAGPATAGDALEAGAQDNTLYGYDAGTALTTGDNNLAVGAYSLIGATTSSQNTALGSNCMTAAVTGNDNTAVGFFSLKDTTSGAYNTAIGRSALQVNTSGGENTALGYNALNANTTGASNTAVGKSALAVVTTGGYNTAVGYGALDALTTSSNCVAIGRNALGANTTGTCNVAVGTDALLANTTASENTAVGQSSLDSNTTGSQNASLGYLSLAALTTGSGNTAIGTEALEANIISNYNTAVGWRALTTCTTGNNVAIGKDALMQDTTGAQNVAMGNLALYTNTTGEANTAIGYQSMKANTTVNGAACVGYNTGYQATTGGDLSLVGVNAGSGITTGYKLQCLGSHAGSTFTTGSDSSMVGYNCQPSAATNYNTVVIGHSATGKGNNSFYAGHTPYHSGNTTTWSTTSDERIKKNITDNTVGLSVVNQLKVRNFEYRTKDEVDYSAFEAGASKESIYVNKTGAQIGIIAQELETVCPDCVTTMSTGVKTVDTDELFWHLINAIKELSTKNDALTARVATLEAA